MQVTEHIHALRIPFKVPVNQDLMLDRFVYAYLIFGDSIHLVDSGVAGSGPLIFDYIQRQGRKPAEITDLILTHAHPDHIGGAKYIKQTIGCPLSLHAAEVDWAENTEHQFSERPVPGFHTLVEGSVAVDKVIQDGDTLELEAGINLQVIHTPGHSKGSISLLCGSESTLLSGDALIPPHEIPLYDDILETVTSVRNLQTVADVSVLLSSWEEPIKGAAAIAQRMNQSLEHLLRIHSTVCEISAGQTVEPMSLCRQVVQKLGLPPGAINPLVAKGFVSSLGHCQGSLTKG
ncbi:MAG TPA: MBL fold metallo-hydrolase [Anaerolineae bacterium]|nr:MBL fold metallo-hydrolase [Anaerolineae bacterium]HMR66263.1 MBL fold metallo-hydrolase [Anaerolineae bacterium]